MASSTALLTAPVEGAALCGPVGPVAVGIRPSQPGGHLAPPWPRRRLRCWLAAAHHHNFHNNLHRNFHHNFHRRFGPDAPGRRRASLA
jgi:hypothetical protein